MEAVVGQRALIAGKHVYGELMGVEEGLLRNEELLRKLVVDAARVARAHLVEVRSWRFTGSDKEGISVIGLVLESHIAIHTWPIYRYATVDVYTCGERSDPEAAFDYIVKSLRPERFTKTVVDRSLKGQTTATPR